jgi:hypothetical protein
VSCSNVAAAIQMLRRLQEVENCICVRSRTSSVILAYHRYDCTVTMRGLTNQQDYGSHQMPKSEWSHGHLNMACCRCCLPHVVVPRPIGLGSEQTYLLAVRELQHLTRLELTLSIADDREPEICSYLSGLVNLQHLKLWFMEGEPRYQDCLSLCRLKSLTHLS